MTTSIFSLPQPPMVCMGTIFEIGNQFCHLDITSQQRFIEALGIGAPVDLAKDSTKFRLRDRSHTPWHFTLFANPNKSGLTIGEFATLDFRSSSFFRDLLALGGSRCCLGVVLDPVLPLECLQLTRIPIEINIYCAPDTKSQKSCEESLSTSKIYLQHPLFVPSGIQYHNPQFFGDTDPSMVGPKEMVRKTMLYYLAFENLAHSKLREGFRYLLQEERRGSDMVYLRSEIRWASKGQWKDLKEQLEEVELKNLKESRPEKNVLKLLQLFPGAYDIDQLLEKWLERILQRY